MNCPKCGGVEQYADGRCKPCKREYQLRRRQDPVKREAERAADRETKRLYQQDPAVREAKREYERRRLQDPAAREAKREAARRRWQDPAVREAQREAARRRRQDPAVRAADRETKRLYQQDPAVREAMRKSILKKYLLTPAAYNERLDAQGGVCRICQKTPNGKKAAARLHVDHDRETGALRGLLCSNCNMGIGHLKHDPETLRAAIRYLEEAAANPIR